MKPGLSSFLLYFCSASSISLGFFLFCLYLFCLSFLPFRLLYLFVFPFMFLSCESLPYLFLLCGLFDDAQYLDHRINGYEYGLLVGWNSRENTCPTLSITNPRGMSKDRNRTSEVTNPELAGHFFFVVLSQILLQRLQKIFFFLFGKRITLHVVWVETVKCWSCSCPRYGGLLGE